jgi:UPF0755 protein
MKVIFGIILLMALIASGIYYYTQNKLEDIYYPDEGLTIEIPKGASISSAVAILNEYGMLQPEWFFTNYIKLNNRINGTSLKAGYFNFPSTITSGEVIEMLIKGGSAPTVMVTIPEGLAAWEIASILKKEIKIDSLKFINLIKNDSLLNARGIDAPSAEGYLFPETFEFYKNGTTAKTVIDRMLDFGENFWQSEIEGRADGQDNLRTKHEILTFASIIEDEASREDEIYTVSGLYHNRLSVGMPMQANATVQYALGAKERVMNEQLKIDSPYNTYKYNGLPPGPIGNPGRRAILAAINPSANDFIFMVAKGDGSGSHYFAKSEREHLANVAKYRRARSRY